MDSNRNNNPQVNNPHIEEENEPSFSLEQKQHQIQNQHDEHVPLVDKKLDGPNRPAE